MHVANLPAKVNLFCSKCLKVMLLDDSQRRFLVQHSVVMLNNVVTDSNPFPTMLQRFVELKIVVVNRLVEHHL